MEANESISDYLSRIEDLREKLADIGALVSSSDLATITLNRMVDDYQVFTTSLAARENMFSLKNLTGVLYKKKKEKSMLKIDFRVQIQL